MPGPGDAAADAAPEIGFRPVEAGDEAFLRSLYASTRADEMALTDWSEAQKAAFLSMQFEAQSRHYLEQFPRASFDLILQGAEPIGRLYVDRRAEEIRIIDIALVPDRRGRGVGGRLIRDLLDEAAAAGKAVRIHVEQDNPAMSLYRRLGFAKMAEHGVYRLMEWRPPSEGVS